jgi:hypothetical protein
VHVTEPISVQGTLLRGVCGGWCFLPFFHSLCGSALWRHRWKGGGAGKSCLGTGSVEPTLKERSWFFTSVGSGRGLSPLPGGVSIWWRFGDPVGASPCFLVLIATDFLFFPFIVLCSSRANTESLVQRDLFFRAGVGVGVVPAAFGEWVWRQWTLGYSVLCFSERSYSCCQVWNCCGCSYYIFAQSWVLLYCVFCWWTQLCMSSYCWSHLTEKWATYWTLLASICLLQWSEL